MVRNRHRGSCCVLRTYGDEYDTRHSAMFRVGSNVASHALRHMLCTVLMFLAAYVPSRAAACAITRARNARIAIRKVSDNFLFLSLACFASERVTVRGRWLWYS